MASTVLGVVGAVIGAPFGLSAVGFAIGSALGGALFGPTVNGPDIEGPRIGDTEVTVSSLGKTIPEHYGVTRASGNVFWSAGLKEVKTVEKTGGGGGKGGGGGGGGKTTTYSYFANFALTFGRGPAEQVTKIWADGKLIFDVNGTGDVQNDKYKFRFRNGAPDQPLDNLIAESINRRLQGLPDVNEGTGPQSTYKTINDLIVDAQTEAAAGDKRAAIYATYLTQLRDNANTTGSVNDYSFTPAYRDMCYIVFENMPLEDFGSRIPNITAEIVWGTYSSEVTSANGQPREVTITQVSTDTTTPATGGSVDLFRSTLVVKSGTQLRRFSETATGETLVASATGGDLGNTAVNRIVGTDANGDAIVLATPMGSTQILAKVSPVSLLISGDRVGSTGSTAFTLGVGNDIIYGASLGNNNNTTLFGGVAPDGYYYVYRTSTANITRQYGGPPSNGTSAGFQLIGDGPVVNGGDGINYVLASDATQYRLTKFTVDWGGLGGITTISGNDNSEDNTNAQSGGNANSKIRVRRNNLFSAQNLNGQTVSGLIYDPSSDRLFALFHTGTASGRIIKYRTNGNVIFDKVLTYAPPSDVSGMQESAVTTGKLVYARDNNVIELDLNTGTETVFTGVLSGNAADTVQVYSGSRDTLYTWIGTQPVRIEMGRNTNIDSYQGANTLQSVISSICSRTGMQGDEYDVTGVNQSLTLRGYTIARPSTGRQALEKLLTSYFIDGIESDYAVKFKDKSSTSIRTLTEDELGTIKSSTGEVNFLESRQPEYDLPSEFNVSFIEQDRDYQKGAALYRRIAQPAPTMYSNKTSNLELPIVFSQSEAEDIAQRMMFFTWISRDAARTKFNWKHLDLDPGDVVQVTFNDGRVITDRIEKQTTGANFEIDIDTIRSGDPVYTASTLSPITTGSVPSLGIATPFYTELFVLDIPLLEDFHDLGRSAFRYYTTIGSDTSQWRTATLYSSLSDDQYTAFDVATIDITWGQCQNVLGAPRVPFATDVDNTITVQLSVDNGDIASTTFENIVNADANRALIYNPITGVGEIIQFETVTNNSDGTITLSRLTRGIRGSDYAMYTHTSGEYFLFLSSLGVETQTNPLDILGTTQYFRAVPVGSLISGAQTKLVNWQGRDLKPYAPSRLGRTENGGNIDITWERRTRIGGEWNMFGGVSETVPLNEDNEEYEFFLLPKTITTPFDPDDTGSYISSHIVSTPTYQITAAQLSAATYSLTDPLNIAVCQRSAQVGRGFITEGTLFP